MNNDTDTSDAFRIGQILGEARITADSVPYVVIPNDVKIASLEHLLPAPRGINSLLQFTEIASFITYVNRHKDEDRSIILAARDPSMAGLSMTCILDHHTREQAGWQRHKALFNTLPTPEWNVWRSFNAKPMGQELFARFIEDNLKDFLHPVGAEMLDLVTRLEGTVEVDFTAGVRLDNGNNELRYVEKTNLSAGTKGSIVLPQVFEIGVVLFEGGTRYAMTARLRYRIKDKCLTFWYDLIKPHLIVNDALGDMLEQVESATGLKPLIGQP